MRGGFNWPILVLVMALFLFSLALNFSFAPHLLTSQFIFVFLGLATFFLIAKIDYQVLAPFWPFLYLAVFLLLGTSFIFQTQTRETLRWVRIGSLGFQPSEIVKPFLIFIFAAFISSENWNFKKLIISLGLLFLPAFLIFQQPDLGSSLVLCLVWLAMIFMKVDKKQTVFLIGFFCLSLLMGQFFMKDYQKTRIRSFLNPMSDPLGEGYQLIQATIAVGSGRLFGRGLLRGTQSHLRFLPERQSDFIFASLAEELGFLGSLILILIYFSLLIHILRIAKKSGSEFGALICVGVFALFFTQIIINVGMNLGLLPITGLTLPLISPGGSSIFSLMMGLGLVESVARKRKIEKVIEIG